MSKGHTNLKLTLNRNAFNSNIQQLELECHIDNKMSEIDVKNMKVKMVRSCFFKKNAAGGVLAAEKYVNEEILYKTKSL